MNDFFLLISMFQLVLNSFLYEYPFLNKEEIEKRYDCIEVLLEQFILTDDLQKYLLEVYDLERLSGRIAFGSANARDLLQLKSSIKVLPYISEILTKINFHKKLIGKTNKGLQKKNSNKPKEKKEI